MIPDIKDKKKLAEWLHANKSKVITQKKSALKYSDPFACNMFLSSDDKGECVSKSDNPVSKDALAIEVVSAINTTKLFDSVGDVHIDGLWTKSIKETKDNYLVKEHNFKYDGVISDDVKVTAVTMKWSDLGFKYKGETQVLVYTSVIGKEDPTGMFDRYRNGKVKQHSVGMRYVKVDLALPYKNYADEYKVWKNYFDQIVNGEEAEMAGFFWAVTEAKNVEGSAVLRGANFATPTISVTESKFNNGKSDNVDEPGNHSEREPRKSTLNIKTLLESYQPKKYIN